MNSRADARRTKIELSGIGLGVSDELGNCLGGKRRIDHNDEGTADNAGDGCNVPDEIEIEVPVERCVDGVRRGDEEERIAVGRRSHDHLGTDIAPCTWPVLSDEWPAQAVRQPLTDQPCGDVRRSAGWKASDNLYRPCRIGLRAGDARQSRQRGSARCEMQKRSTGKFHRVVPLSEGGRGPYAASESSLGLITPAIATYPRRQRH